MSQKQRDAMLKRVVTGMHKTLLEELGQQHRFAAGGRVLLVHVSDEEALVLLNALVNVTASLIASTDDSFDIYQWFSSCLADNVRRIDLELHSADGKTLQ